MKIVSDGGLLWFMKICEKYIDFFLLPSSPYIILSVLLVRYIHFGGKKNPKKNLRTLTPHMGMASYFCALSCPVAIPTAWTLLRCNILPCSTRQSSPLWPCGAPSAQGAACRAAQERDINTAREFSVFSECEFSCVPSR